jgi:glutamate 5-kinase
MRIGLRLLTALLLLASIDAVSQNAPRTNPNKARVFITDSKSWEVSGGGGGTSGGFGSGGSGGARPQTAEIIKTFSERCPDVIVNNKQEKADYVVLLDHEGGKAFFLHDNKVVVFNKDGDSILAHSTRSLGNSVRDACDAIAKDWFNRPRSTAGR